MTQQDAHAAAARVLLGRVLAVTPPSERAAIRTAMKAVIHEVAAAILAAWKQGAEEMRERAEVVLVEERLKHVVARPAFGNGLAFGATMVRALKVTE